MKKLIKFIGKSSCEFVDKRGSMHGIGRGGQVDRGEGIGGGGGEEERRWI